MIYQTTYKNEDQVITLTGYDDQKIYYITAFWINEPRTETIRITKEEWDKDLKYLITNGIFLYRSEDFSI